MNFVNKLTHNGIHYSRYIASWTKVLADMGLKPGFYGEAFEKWLREEQGLTAEEISDIQILASNGKLELEESIRTFMEKRRWPF